MTFTRKITLAVSLLSAIACSSPSSEDDALASVSPNAGDLVAPSSQAREHLDVAPTPLAPPPLDSLTEATIRSVPGVSPADWMAQTPGLAAKRLSAIYMPGTHDSGTYELQSVYERPADDAWAPDDNENGFLRFGQFIGVTAQWAKAQERNLLQQLEDGNRYLDLRPCREKNGTLRICHGLYGPKLSDLVDQIATFAKAHPKEIVIVHSGTFAGFTPADHAAYASMVRSKLGAQLVDYRDSITPATTLGSLWTSKPGRNVIMIYNHGDRAPEFWPQNGALHNSWNNTWLRDKKKTKLAGDLASSTSPGRFFLFSGNVTPDGDSITRSFDPVGTYPDSLASMADDTNPVLLGWVANEWSSRLSNIISIDFYNRTCIFALTQRLNGNTQASTSGCKIGTPTEWGTWGTWRVGSYGRTAGKPLVCSPNQENVSGLCYSKCDAGWQTHATFPYLCFKPCPAGYRDDGLTCFRDAHITSANNSSCPWYDVCGLTFAKGCSTCPTGYVNDGCTCRRDAHALTKDRYNRGAGTVPSSCGAGEEKDGALCYPRCDAGYKGVGPVCWIDK